MGKGVDLRKREGVDDERELRAIVIESLFERRPGITGIWANWVEECFDEDVFWIEFRCFPIYEAVELGWDRLGLNSPIQLKG